MLPENPLFLQNPPNLRKDSSQFYLAGGTALAGQSGHRISQDLDLFANAESFDDSLRGSIVEALREGHSANLRQNSVMGVVLNVDAQPARFFSYCYPLLAPIEKAVW